MGMLRLLRTITANTPNLSRQRVTVAGQYVRQMCSDNKTETLSEKVFSMVSRQVPNSPTITLNNWPYNLRIRPNDILDPNDVNSFRASLVSADPSAGFELRGPAPLRITSDENHIQIHTTDDAPTSNHALICLLEVPVQSELDISGQRNIHVEKLYSDLVRLRTTSGDISTHNLNGFRFDFATDGGNVHCTGNTLANQIDIRTRGHGNIHLTKMQGDLLYAISDSGSITTESCYSEASKFVTLNGRLVLRNVHKFSEMYLLSGGSIEVTGFHGRLVAKLNETGRASFQITELHGDSCIEALGGAEKGEDVRLKVNLSDFVLGNNALDVSTAGGAQIRVDATLDEYREHLSSNGDTFRRDNPEVDLGDQDDNLLTVRSAGDVHLGKMSWTDTLMKKFNVK